MTDARISGGLEGRFPATFNVAVWCLLLAVAGCSGDEPVVNECGGSGVLPAQVGASCGPCNDGVYQCAGGDDVACMGAGANNNCGGCAVLPQPPGAACVTDRGMGVWQCDGVDDVICATGGTGACGGAVDPEPLPGVPCGDCGLGRTVCDGPATVVCNDAFAGLNDCGSCGELPGAPGDDCGECGGQLVCYQGGLICYEAGRNRCGGCSVLEGDPGDPCADGFLVCTPLGEVSCQPSAQATNACGGLSALENQPGQSCGACGDGWTLCASPEGVVCAGASETNACGGCGPLPGVPGEICAAEGWAWTCTADKTLTCADRRNEQPLGLTITPDDVALRVGQEATLTAWLRLTPTTRENKTTSASWTTSDSDVATVKAGKVTAVSAGTVTITARFEGHVAELQLDIKPGPAEMVSLSIEPSSLVVRKDSTATLLVVAHYDDGTQRAVTEWVAWWVEKPSVASVSGEVVSGLAPGITQVVASFQSLTASAQVEVRSPPFTGLSVSAASTVVSVGASTQLTAAASRHGEPAVDVTGSTAWKVQPADRGTVDATGRLTAVAAGTVTVVGTYENLTASVTLEVKAPIDSLVVAASPTSIPLGMTSQLVATGTRSGGAPEDVTAQVAWTVSPLDAGSVDAFGRFVPAAIGTATILGQLDGKTASVEIEVRAPAVVALLVRPDTLRLEQGATSQLHAIAELDNGTEEDVTARAFWTSDAPAKVSVAAGLVTALGSGFTNVRASLDGREGAARIEVPGPPVTALTLTPGVPLTLTIGVCVPFEVMATFASGESSPATADVAWSFTGEHLSATAVAGRYCVVGIGSGSVKVELGGQSASVTVQGVVRPAHVGSDDASGTVYRVLHASNHVAAETTLPGQQWSGHIYRTLLAGTAHVAAETDTHHIHRKTFPSNHVTADPRSHHVTRP